MAGHLFQIEGVSGGEVQTAGREGGEVGRELEEGPDRIPRRRTDIERASRRRITSGNGVTGLRIELSSVDAVIDG